jgi:hypothetical protein
MAGNQMWLFITSHISAFMSYYVILSLMKYFFDNLKYGLFILFFMLKVIKKIIEISIPSLVLYDMM